MKVLNDQVVPSVDLFVPKVSHGRSGALASTRRSYCPMVDCGAVMSEYCGSHPQMTHLQQSEVLAYLVYLNAWLVKTKPSLFLSFSFCIELRRGTWEGGQVTQSSWDPESVPPAVWSPTPAWTSSMSVHREVSQWPLCLKCLMFQNRDG